MSKVGGEAVAEVDGCGGEVALKERCADGESWLREEVRVVCGGCGSGGTVGFQQSGEFGVSTAERAGDIESITGLRTGASQREAVRSGANENDIGEDEVCWRFGGVATGERYIVLLRESTESAKKSFDPALTVTGAEKMSGKSEGEEGGYRGSSHGGEIAEAAGEAAMADGCRRMEVAAEVAVLQGEVSGDEDFMTGGMAQDGAVIADA